MASTSPWLQYKFGTAGKINGPEWTRMGRSQFDVCLDQLLSEHNKQVIGDSVLFSFFFVIDGTVFPRGNRTGLLRRLCYLPKDPVVAAKVGISLSDVLNLESHEMRELYARLIEEATLAMIPYLKTKMVNFDYGQLYRDVLQITDRFRRMSISEDLSQNDRFLMRLSEAPTLKEAVAMLPSICCKRYFLTFNTEEDAQLASSELGMLFRSIQVSSVNGSWICIVSEPIQKSWLDRDIEFALDKVAHRKHGTYDGWDIGARGT